MKYWTLFEQEVSDMRNRRREDHENTRRIGSGNPPGGGSLESMRRAGEDLLSAADKAIQRALSGDSEAFLRANRQEGGQ